MNLPKTSQHLICQSSGIQKYLRGLLTELSFVQITNQYRALARLTELIGNLREIKQASEGGTNSVNLSRVDWVCPISFLPIVSYANKMGISVMYSGHNRNIRIYLNAIHFPDGINELTTVRRNFLPITRVNCDDCNDMLTQYEDRILEKLPQSQRQEALTGLKYLTSELEANIREHAQVESYWIFAQYWARSRTCEIGICDSGIGYKQSYVGTRYEVTRHIDAIMNALEGRSSKTPDERGSGIPTIARILDEGYGGQLIIMSGDSFLLSDQGEKTGYRFNLTFDGSFIGFRFSLRGINIYDFL